MLYITTHDSLAHYCDAARHDSFIALDTEFMRERTYFPQLCLIQVASSAGIALIDALVPMDWTPLQSLLQNPHCVKVLHSSQQDCMALLRDIGMVPSPLFDTQTAIQFLGHPTTISYQQMVEEWSGVTLNKEHQRTNWALRPLPSEVLEYAADDVRYLHRLYAPIADKLSAKGHMAWMQEDMARYTDPQRYTIDQEKIAASFAPPIQTTHCAAITYHLALWREKQASQRNWLRQHVMHDNQLLYIARAIYKGRYDPQKIGLHAMRAASLEPVIAAIADQLKTMKDRPLPRFPAIDTELLTRLRSRYDAIVTSLHIAPSLLCNQGDLKRIAQLRHLPTDHPLTRGWRYEAMGRELESLVGIAHAQPEVLG